MSDRSLSRPMSLEIVLTDSDETITVTTSMQDQLRWEANNSGLPWLGGGAPSHTKMLETAYYAGRRMRLIEEKQFDLFKRRVQDLRILDDDGDDEPDESDDNSPDTFQ